jgi:hypothetical protein
MEAAMRAVDLHLNRAGFGESLSDMRRWLDHNDCVPASFGTQTESAGTVLVHVEFREDKDAEAFEHEFGG